MDLGKRGLEFGWGLRAVCPLINEAPPLVMQIPARPPAAAAKNPPAERLPSGPPARRGRTRDPSRPARRHQGPARSTSIAVSHENRDGHLVIEPERPRPKNDLCRSADRTAGAAAVPARRARGPVRQATTASAGPAIRSAHGGCGLRRRAVFTPAPRARYRPVDYATTSAGPRHMARPRRRGPRARERRSARARAGNRAARGACRAPKARGGAEQYWCACEFLRGAGARRPGQKSQGAGCRCCFAPRARPRGGKRACSRARTPDARRSEVWY